MKHLFTPHALAVCSVLALILESHAQGTAFTYQGHLMDDDGPVNGLYDLQARLWPSASGEFIPPLGIVTVNDVAVTNGLFTVTLDYGSLHFSGADRWLELGVRPGASSGSYTNVSPRQRITSTPYAIRAGGVPAGSITSSMLVDGAVTTAKLAPGAIEVSQLATPDGTQTNVAQVSNEGLLGIGTDQPMAGLHIASGASFLRPDVLFQVQDGSGSYTNLRGAVDVAATADLLAVASLWDDTIMLLDVTNPNAPVVQSQLNSQGGVFTHLNGAHGLAFSGTMLAVASWFGDAVTLIDVSDPTNPTQISVLEDGVGGFDDLKSAYHVAFSGSLMAVSAFEDNAVTLADVSNPANPVLLAVLKDGVDGFNDLANPRHLALSGNLLAVGALDDDAVSLVNVSDPENPVLWKVLKDEVDGFNELDGANAVAIFGNTLAIAAFSDDAVSLVDVSNPALPLLRSVIKDEVGGFAGLDGPIRLSYSGDLLAISANLDDAITLVDVGDVSDPRLKGTFRDGLAGLDYLNTVEGLTFVNGTLAVAAFGDDGLTLLSPEPETLSLTTADWVGIGTTVPLAPLHVVGDVIVDSAARVSLQADQIALGTDSHAGGQHSTAMGNFTKAEGNHSTAMGYFSVASGFASLAAGRGTAAAGNNAFALGEDAKANHDGSFVWSDTQPGDFTSQFDNQFRVRATGGARFDVNSSHWVEIRAKANGINPPFKLIDTSTDAYLSQGGTWVNSSDRSSKEHVVAVDGSEILEQLADLPISRWNYRAEQGTPHLGPMAQDFHAAFGVGADDTHIATIDADGVALAAIQGLHQIVEQKEAKITELERRLEKVERLLSQTQFGGGK